MRTCGLEGRDRVECCDAGSHGMVWQEWVDRCDWAVRGYAHVLLRAGQLPARAALLKRFCRSVRVTFLGYLAPSASWRRLGRS